MAIRIICTGKVQGVFFRASAKSIADDLGIKGWVMNEADGSVLIHAEGTDEKREKMKAWCLKGSDYSKVKEIKVFESDEEGCSSFEIRF
ncbi:MAG: acylphosphatase [Marinoscillum sp.]|jgi:acylphosphatase